MSDQHNAKIIKITFKFPVFLSTQNQYTLLIPSWDTANFNFLRPELPHPFFDHTHTNIFQSTFNFYEPASTCKKSGFFIVFVLEI